MQGSLIATVNWSAVTAIATSILAIGLLGGRGGKALYGRLLSVRHVETVAVTA